MLPWPHFSNPRLAFHLSASLLTTSSLAQLETTAHLVTIGDGITIAEITAGDLRLEVPAIRVILATNATHIQVEARIALLTSSEMSENCLKNFLVSAWSEFFDVLLPPFSASIILSRRKYGRSLAIYVLTTRVLRVFAHVCSFSRGFGISSEVAVGVFFGAFFR
jgi:hypothetical protein